jgi:hypothetical protein
MLHFPAKSFRLDIRLANLPGYPIRTWLGLDGLGPSRHRDLKASVTLQVTCNSSNCSNLRARMAKARNFDEKSLQWDCLRRLASIRRKGISSGIHLDFHNLAASAGASQKRLG